MTFEKKLHDTIKLKSTKNITYAANVAANAYKAKFSLYIMIINVWKTINILI